jgi:hypothetical protein
MHRADELDNDIRALVAALVDTSPPAPPLPYVRAATRRRPSRRHVAIISLPLTLLLVGVAAASISALGRSAPGVSRLFLRVTDGGIAIRAYRSTNEPALPQIEVGLSRRDAVGYLTAIAVTNPPGADWFYPEAATSFGSGASGGNAVVVSVGPNIKTVRATFASGASDAMHPVSGWAVLAAPGVNATGQLVGFDAIGRQVASAHIPAPTPSGEGFPGESTATFSRVTNQGVVVIGHTVRPFAQGQGWLYPYLADRTSVQMGLEGIPACRPSSPSGVAFGVLEVDAQQGQPMTVVIVHSGAAIASVLVRYANDVTDSMRTVAGQAVLATVGTIQRRDGIPRLKGGVLEAFTSSGQLLSSRHISLQDSAYQQC